MNMVQGEAFQINKRELDRFNNTIIKEYLAFFISIKYNLLVFYSKMY